MVMKDTWTTFLVRFVLWAIFILPSGSLGQGCYPDSWGPNCSNLCSGGCYGSICDEITGACPCKDAFVGDRCDECKDSNYGFWCNIPCSENCVDKCAIDGSCQCEVPYGGPTCDDCAPNRYGTNCTLECPTNCRSSLCDRDLGHCTDGCLPGYTGEMCDNVCRAGWYGLECIQPCPSNCRNAVCHHEDGNCTDGCEIGFSGPHCASDCPNGTYGLDCNQTCSPHCVGGECWAVKGYCDNGCTGNYTGQKCDIVCEAGTHGYWCHENCSQNCKDGQCHPLLGHCYECADGYYDGPKEMCEKTCPSLCKYDVCNQTNGHCLYGCEDGFKGPWCWDWCENGKYGPDCSLNCSVNCFQHNDARWCDSMNGFCLLGCVESYEGDLCTETTSVTTDWQTSNATTTAPTTSAQRYYQCHVDSVDLAIPVSVVPNSKLHLKESSCQLQNNGTHHVLSFGYHECGTSVAYYTDYVYATNDITVESTLPPNGLVVFADDYTIPLECRFHHEQFVNGAFQAVAIDSTILGRRGGADAADFILREFRTELYQDVITEYPAQIPLNKELFVEIALANANGGTTGIVVKECKATPSNDDNDNTTYTLIQDGCPAQPTVQLQPNPHNETFRFSLQAFHFADPINQNNMVYLHCDVSICPVTSCKSNCAATKRRRRRSIAQLVDTVTVSSGPYLLV